ncbi:histidine kinase [Chimaeribacter californicus]|uniref:histidine kinase n=1 Tax=Chimaeribacter californicus TaxID=2060067 RepID=A0A2N5EEY2_9GAMM|nr:sensor histidine kinase [Chimaeribacter californicus]PLR41088.1 histidine kinase [Chimaeribacter californicus]
MVMTGYFSRMEKERLHYQVGQRALVQARQIAAMPSMVEAVAQQDTDAVKALATRLRALSDATYITIGDSHGVRLFHVDEEKIGALMEGGDSGPALKDGRSYLSERRGSLGTSLRGKAPVRTADGRIIGIVSVGYTLSQLESWMCLQRNTLLLPMLLLLLFLLVCAWCFSLHIKRQMRSLEPDELARLLIQQEVLFESVFEGLIAIDAENRIIAINQAARRMLGLVQPVHLLTGEPVQEIVHPGSFFLDSPGQDKKDDIASFNNVKVIASRMGICINGIPQGAVISFRNKDDINTLSLQLSQIQQYADNLRAMRHEQINTFSTLAGLLHIKAYDDAMNMIQAQSERHQKIVDYVTMNFRNNPLAGLLIGKYYRAQELGIELTFDPGCYVAELPESLTHNEWISIVGNLLDNAFIATLKQPGSPRVVEFYLNAQGDEVVLEVADHGCGIPEAIRARIFERGITTSTSGDHGIGLWLVDSYVRQAGGTIFIDDNTPAGTIFTLTIPW